MSTKINQLGIAANHNQIMDIDGLSNSITSLKYLAILKLDFGYN